MARRKKKPADLSAPPVDQSYEERQQELHEAKINRVYENARSKSEMAAASMIGAEQGRIDGVAMAQQVVASDPVAAARARYLGDGAAPSAGGGIAPPPAVPERFYEAKDGRRLPEKYLSLPKEAKLLFDAEYERLNSLQAQDKADGALALESSATVLRLLDENNTVQRGIAADVAALADRLEAVETSDRELEIQVKNEGAEAAREAAVELSQSVVQAAEVSSRLDDASRRAERSAEEFEGTRQQAAAALAADREAIDAQVVSLKASVRLSRDLATQNQEGLLRMRDGLNEAASELQQLGETLTAAKVIGDQQRTVDLATARAEERFNELLFNTPGVADIRAVLGLNVSSVRAWLQNLTVQHSNGILGTAEFESQRDSLLALERIINRNQERFTLPGADPRTGDPIVN